MVPGDEKEAREANGLVVLVADDDPAVCNICREVAGSLGLRVRLAGSTEEALEKMEQQRVDLVLADLRMPSAGGMELLDRLKQTHPQVEVILMTGYGSVETAVEAIKKGAYDYLAKPFHLDDLRAKLQHAVNALELTHENVILREQARGRPGFGGLVGTSPKMQRLYKLTLKVSQSRHPVLIVGESGTGKELVARSIHFLGPLKEKPFVPVDCAGLVPTLIESELFGYVKGAFTGAMRAKQGLVEMARGGTLFLDEIAELPPDLQGKLLRALQEKEIKPVGGTQRVPIVVRVVAATNRDLDQAMQEGRFRKDLYYRLNVVTLKLAPLREHRSDIPLLVNYFLERYNDTHRRVRSVSEEAMARLMSYDWPGNVRELENVIERAIALGSGPVLHTVDLPSNLQTPAAPAAAALPGREGILPLRELEKRAILQAVQELGGDKLLAARLLGIGKTTLYRKLKEYELEA
ncbi:sigma-54 dependent transcriptional regulator [Acidobacteriia bacterium AH_259_A11_L15]|nr:sigma-54 dependent transcriptional regulator [Acidobacteriia bacterium AH_259_A11_L15]